MSIDTRQKRASALHIAQGWRAILPPADGAIDAGDRQTVAFVYSGILAAELIVSPLKNIVGRQLVAANIVGREPA